MEQGLGRVSDFIDRNAMRVTRWGSIGMMLIHILRRPTWTYLPDHRDNYTNLDEYPGWGISRLDSTASYSIDIVLCVITFHGILRLLKNGGLSNGRERALRYVTIPLCVIKVLECMVQIPLALADQPRAFVASPIEAIILFTSEPSFEDALFSTMYRSLPYYLGLISILVCVIISWSTLGLIIISNDVDHPDPGFTSLGQSIWTMLNVLNTANWPSPIIPSYNRSSGYFFFFLFYSVVVDWGFLNLILGLIVAFFENSWEKKLVKERRKSMKRQSLKAAAAKVMAMNARDKLRLIDQVNDDGPSPSAGGSEAVVHNPMKALFGEIRASHDEGGSGASDKIPGEEEENERSRKAGIETDMLKSTSIFLLDRVRAVVNSKAFDVIMDMILLVVALLFITTEVPRTLITLQISINVVELVFRMVFLPKGMKLLEWFQVPRNWSNLMYIVCLVTSAMIYLHMCDDDEHGDCAPSHLNRQISWRMNSTVLFFILMIRTTILIRCTFVLRNVSWDVLPQWVQLELSRVATIIQETFKGFMHLCLMLFLIMYIFACTGQMIFGGLLSKNPDLPDYEKLMHSAYSELGYWPLNFNDMPSSMVSMFTLLYVNNMYVLASGCAAVSSAWSEIFFGAYYLLGVLFIRNIFTSFLWSRIGKILDRTYMPVENTNLREDYFSKITDVMKTCMRRYDNVMTNMESNAKAKSRAVDSMINAEMSLIESTGVLLQYSRLGEAHTLFKMRNSLLAFRLRYKYVYPLLGCCWLLTFLRVYQKPYWLLDNPEEEQNLDKYFLGNVSYLHPAVYTAFKVPLFSVIIAALCAELVYKADGTQRMLDSHVSVITRYFLLMLSCLSVSCSIGSGLGNLTCQKMDWMLSFCSVYYNLWFDRHALKRLIILVGVVPTLFALVAILMVFIAFMAGFSYFVFHTSNLDHDDDDQNKDYFNDYPDAVWNTLMAITSSSFPSQFMPAYRAYREYAFYFVPLIVIGGFLFLEGSIAVVNTAYRGRTDALQAALAGNRQSVMTSAFDALRHETGVRIVEETIVAKTIESEMKGTATKISSVAHMNAKSNLDADDSGNDSSDDSGDDNESDKPQTTRKPAAPRKEAQKVSGADDSPRSESGDLEMSGMEAEKVMHTRRESALETSGLSAIEGRGKGFYNSSHKGKGSLTDLTAAEGLKRTSRASLVERLTMGVERISMNLVKDISVNELKAVRAEASVHYDEEKEEISSIISTDYIHGSVIDDLFTEVFSHYNDFFKFNILRSLCMKGNSEKKSDEVTAIMRNVLDINNDGRICSEDFHFLLIVCRLKFARIGEEEMDFMEKQNARRAKRVQMQTEGAPTWYERIYYQLWFLRRSLFLGIRSLMVYAPMVRKLKKNHWDALTDSIAGLLSIACCLSWRESGGSWQLHQTLLDVFFALITVEMFFKMLFMSHYHYWAEARNKVDFAVWACYLMLTVVALIGGDKGGGLSQYDMHSDDPFEFRVAYTRELLVVIRLLLFPRNVTLMANPVNGVAWESVLTTIAALTFAFAEGFISFYFTYTQLGVLIFGGSMTRPGYNPDLDTSRFGKDNYYILNFNDMVSAFSTLFCALRVSDFDVITEGFVIVTGSRSTRIYFALWYIFGVLLFFNVLKSYFISVFQPKESNSKSKASKESADDDTTMAENSSDRRRSSLMMEEVPGINDSPNAAGGGEDDGEFLSAKDISIEELEARNLNGEILIDYYDILTNPKYVDGEAELEDKTYRASGVQRHVDLPVKRKCKFVVSLPFKVSMDPDDREVVLRRLYFLSVKELKRSVKRRVHSFVRDSKASEESSN